MTNPVTVEVTRGSLVESRHRGTVVAMDGDGKIVFSIGDIDAPTFPRSACKAMQALPLMESGAADAYGFGDKELALACSSHNGEDEHVALAAAMLAKAGRDVETLECGAHWSSSQKVLIHQARTIDKPTALHNNCSGKHAGMLAHCVQQQWVTNGYHRANHPMQQRVKSTLARWMRIDADDMSQGVDGCGLPTFALALDAVADGCAKFAAAVAAHDPAPSTIFHAMVTHPEFVSGTDRLDTDLMRIAGQRLFAKFGAEGFYCVGIPSMRLGIALKVEDGARRAAEPALLAVLRTIDAIDGTAFARLSNYGAPELRNTRDEPVGHLRVAIELSGRL